MKKLLVILALTFGLTYSINSNANEKVDLIFCASDMTRYADPRYSEPYLKSTFGGKCPRSKPFEITYNQMREKVSSNYKLYLFLLFFLLVFFSSMGKLILNENPVSLENSVGSPFIE